MGERATLSGWDQARAIAGGGMLGAIIASMFNAPDWAQWLSALVGAVLTWIWILSGPTPKDRTP